VKDGLSSNCIWSILQDKNGNIWLGTSDGVSCYDGKQFTAISFAILKDNNLLPKNSMDDNTSKKTAVFSMLQTKSGELWFGTTEGMYCYNGISFYRFLNNNIINRDSIQLKTIEAILEDRNGNIWFGSYTGEGICRFDGKYLTRLEPNVKNLKFDYVRVMCIIEDKNGDILFGTGDGAYRYNGITLTNFAKEAGVHWVYNIIADKKENLWFATEMGGGQMGEDGGVWCYDGKSYKHYTTNEGLIHNGVFCIVEDNYGNIWFGTRNTRLSRYDGNTFTSFSE